MDSTASAPEIDNDDAFKGVGVKESKLLQRMYGLEISRVAEPQATDWMGLDIVIDPSSHKRSKRNSDATIRNAGYWKDSALATGGGDEGGDADDEGIKHVKPKR